MANPESSPYQPKHRHSIIDQYNGICSGVMELNPKVADRFMQVGDIRQDIIINQKQSDRVLDYESVGDTKVAKFLSFPRLKLPSGSRFVSTGKYDNKWVVSINDQELAEEVSRQPEDSRPFNDRFVDAFRSEVGSGLKNILVREKLLNGNNPDFNMLFGYMGVSSFTAVLSASLLTSNEIPFSIAALLVSWNLRDNLFMLTISGVDAAKRRLGLPVRSFLGTNLQDPFVRHSIPELFLPTVPVDRLLRGSAYLGMHQKSLINQIEPE